MKRNHGMPLLLFIVESDLTPSLSGVKMTEVVEMHGMMERWVVSRKSHLLEVTCPQDWVRANRKRGPYLTM